MDSTKKFWGGDRGRIGDFRETDE